MTQRGSVSKFDDIRRAAEADLLTFILLVAPKRMIGDIHRELLTWWYRPDARSHQLVLLPRGHQKSTFIAFRVAWEITRNPAVTVMYLSATAGLAEQQLGLIKSILTSTVYRRYWPEMVHQDEGKREKWSVAAIAIDHPKRKEEQVRDPTCFAVGLTSNVVGWHCDILVLDDVVVPDNAYTEEQREKVKVQYSLLNSICNPGAPVWVVGTRYHPNDLYGLLLETVREIFNAAGEPVAVVPVFEVFERQVEDRGDGSGEYLWPRIQRYDGQWFGFNQEVLAGIKAGYLDKTQFYAQYYNNPNISEDSGIRRDRFQYYERNNVRVEYGAVFVRGKKVNVFGAVDFAFSLTGKADFTAIAVVGVDEDGHIYVLEIRRFKTDKISDYFENIRELHIKWGFRKLRAEVTAAQAVVVKELKDQYFRPHGLALSVDEFRPSKQQGSKEERIDAILQPRYENMSIWHYRGGETQALEDELIAAHPAHDDLKDALAAAVDVSVPPRGMGRTKPQSNVIYSNRFGGVF